MIHRTPFTAHFADGDHGIELDWRFEWTIAAVVTQADRAAFSQSLKLAIINLKNGGPLGAIEEHNKDFRSQGLTEKPKHPTVAFIVEEEALEQHPRFKKNPIFRVKPGMLRAVDGYSTSNGFFLPIPVATFSEMRGENLHEKR